MKWNKFRLTTTTEAEDIVSSMLMDLGIQGVEIEDKVPLTQSDKEQPSGVLEPCPRVVQTEELHPIFCEMVLCRPHAHDGIGLHW